MAPLNPQAPHYIPAVESPPAPLAAPHSLAIPYSYSLPMLVPEPLPLQFCCYYQGLVPQLPVLSRLTPFYSFLHYAGKDLRLAHGFPSAGVEFLGLPWPPSSFSPIAMPSIPTYQVAVPLLRPPPIYPAKDNLILDVLPKQSHDLDERSPSPPPRAIILRKRRVRIGPRLKMKPDSLAARPRRLARPNLNVKIGSFWLPRLRCLRKKSPEDEKFRVQLQFNEGTPRDEDEDYRTTVMIKNLPNKLRKEDLLALLDSHCLEENKAARCYPRHRPSRFDFFYLPMDFGTGSNLGYAFVNFTCSEGAWRLHHAFHQMKWDFMGSKKICEITYARIQGLPSLLKHFRSSVFVCDDDELLPLYFVPHRDGAMQYKDHHVGQRVSKCLYGEP